MSNDIVRYNNKLNSVGLRGFSPVEMDIFWSICSKMKRKGTQEQEFDFDTFRELAHYDRREKESFYNALKAFSEKLGQLDYKFEDSTEFEQLWLFQRFLIQKDQKKVVIQASERFEFILNSINTNFTRFELETMVDFSSTYTKELYRMLVAHRDSETKSGAWFVKMEDFRELLSIPKSYRMTDITRQVLNVATKEFTEPNKKGRIAFSDFRIEKVKARKGNKIASLRFYFQEEHVKIPGI